MMFESGTIGCCFDPFEQILVWWRSEPKGPLKAALELLQPFAVLSEVTFELTQVSSCGEKLLNY
jgi:hypothetical protein